MSRPDKRRATFGLAYHFAPPRAAETMGRAAEAARVLIELQARFNALFLDLLARAVAEQREGVES